MESDEIEKTVRLYGDDAKVSADKTEMLIHYSSTVRIEDSQNVGGDKVIRSGLGGGIGSETRSENIYKLNGNEYSFIRKLSDSTTEAQIFLISKSDEKFVLKYYYPFVKPKKDIIERLLSFTHPDIVNVIDYGYFEERFFEILSYADQGSLAEHLPITNVELLKHIVEETTNALDYCHNHGIIHRDVKPSNIFIMDKENKDVVLGDFGIASIIDDEKELRRTSIFQTPIYAAPEYKMTLRGETVISKAVDYYALGITIWELWTGELPPRGMDDLEFLRLMFEGTPPLSREMNEEIATLIRGLTTRDYKKRWGIKEVASWLKGESVEVYIEETNKDISGFEFGQNDQGEKLTARTPAQLAELIAEDPDLGRKHLYRGTIKDWLKEKGDKGLYIEIADVTEYKYKDKEEVGTACSIYLLDREYPFLGLKNKSCRTKEELIKELRSNFSDYKELLKDPDHNFYLYLLSKNFEDEVEDFRSFYKRFDETTSLHYIIYSLEFSLNKNTPFHFDLKEKLIPVGTFAEVAGILRQHPFLGEGLERDKDFRIWMYVKNPTLFNEYDEFVKKHSESKRFYKLLPYFFEEEFAYTGLDGRKCISHEDIGKEFADNFDKYKTILKSPESEIYSFLEIKEYDGEIEYFQKVFDMDFASSKPAVYNDDIALCKIIKGCGFYMPFRTSTGLVFSPDEFAAIYPKLKNELKPILENKNSFLNAWLSVFFHEHPLNEDETMYIHYLEDYEARLKKHLRYFEKLDPSLEVVQRYKKGLKIVEKNNLGISSFSNAPRIEVFLAFALPLLSAVALFIYLLNNESDLPLNIFELDSWYYITWAIGTAAWLLWNGYELGEIEFSTSCVGGPILGVIMGVIAYYIFWFLISVPLLLGVVLAVALYFIYLKLSDLSIDYLVEFLPEEYEADNQEIENSLFGYIFGNESRLEIEKPESLKLVKKDRRIFRLKAWSIGLAFTIIMIIILFVVISFSTNIQG